MILLIKAGILISRLAETRTIIEPVAGISISKIATNVTEACLAERALKVVAPHRPLNHNSTSRVQTLLPFEASGALVKGRLSGVGLLIPSAASARAMEVVVLAPGLALRAQELV